jgi:DNA-binding MarR family transcriptional regulator
MENNNLDIKFLLLEKLNLIEELSFIEAKRHEFETNDIVTATRIITLIQNGIVTPSLLGKKLNISRQAIHKSINNLCEKGYLCFDDKTSNKKNKQINITKKGNELLVCRKEVMNKVENTIKKNIGQEEFTKLKELLSKKWD